MGLEFKDYYRVLGVEKSATDDEIRKAFRKLARQYHPDVASDKDKKKAEERFKEVNEAYEVLGDPEKRRKYDELGPNWEQFAHAGAGAGPGGFPGAGAGQPGGGTTWRTWTSEGGDFEFGGTGFSDFFETFFGGGNWSDGGTFTRPGPGAGGGPRAGRDVHADIMVTLEEALHGSVRQITMRRGGGSGKPPRTETYQVRIPAGVREGQMIRLAGQGEGGRGGGQPGDIFLRVRLERHPDFRVQGPDLYYTLVLAPWEAVLGAQVPVPTLAGSVMLRVPPGTGQGTRLRLRGQGLPHRDGGRGDLFAEAKIEVPATLNSQERELWERLARESTFRPRD